jgi:hypothetical protein
MTSSGSSIERRGYTSASWVRKEESQMRMKAQGQPSTTKAEKAHQVLIPCTSKSIALIQMDVDHQKIGRKI